MSWTNCENAKTCGRDLCVPEFCKQYEPKKQTNADRIRAMTDEELAECIINGISSDNCDYCEYNNDYCDGSPCRGKADAEIIVDWLKQPYGGAEHE